MADPTVTPTHKSISLREANKKAETCSATLEKKWYNDHTGKDFGYVHALGKTINGIDQNVTHGTDTDSDNG